MFLLNNKLKYSDVVFYLLVLSTIYILIYNIFHYSPSLGYDAEAHFLYVDHLARYLPYEFNIPSASETREFFNPPLAYVFPSIVQVFCRNIIQSSNYLSECRPIYATFTQIFQSFLYLLTIFINIYTLKKFTKQSNFLNASYLILISLLAVNYRTISMIRGEPYILFFLSLLIYWILKIDKLNYEFNFKTILILGSTIGFLALSRQWAFLLFLPLITLLFSKRNKLKRLYFKTWSLSALVGAGISSWFYLNLYNENGSFTAFNMASTKFSIYNQPLNFYIPNLDQLGYIFTKPIRPYLDNQFISILYSDLWGDYWGYFSFTSRFLDIGRNQESIGNYLSNVVSLSIITTILIFIYYIRSFKKNKKNFIIQYINYSVLFSLFGFLIFTISYPVSTGDTIKSTYIIQMFHLIVFMASIEFEKLKFYNIKKYNILLTILLIIYIYNFQTFLSHFPLNFYNF
tara:strand:+ start:299 stop:1672 length:1374 start_codon:yes stop_codon:yes gene_type:complete